MKHSTSKVTARKPAGSLILVWKSCLQKQKSISIRCNIWLKDKPLRSQNYSVSPDIQSFISDMIDNFVKFKNDHADIIINTPITLYNLPIITGHIIELYSRPMFFHKKVPFLPNIERCPKFLGYSLNYKHAKDTGKNIPIQKEYIQQVDNNKS